jgi:hypothetical protein
MCVAAEEDVGLDRLLARFDGMIEEEPVSRITTTSTLNGPTTKKR